MNLSSQRTINPFLALLIIAIFGSVMSMLITRTADAVTLFLEEQELLALYLNVP